METTLTPAADRIDMAAIEAELRPLSSDRLRSAFVENYGKAAAFIARAAVCVKLMEERGEDLRGIPQLGLFRRVASGQLLPELIWKFIESPGRQVVERAPLNDQKKLADDPVRPVVEPAAGGGYTTRMVDLSKAPAAVVRQVLGPDGLRDPGEQIAFLATNRPRAAAPAEPAADRVDEPLSRQLTVKFTEKEFAALRVNAARENVSEAVMVRRALVKSGVLKEGKGA